MKQKWLGNPPSQPPHFTPLPNITLPPTLSLYIIITKAYFIHITAYTKHAKKIINPFALCNPKFNIWKHKDQLTVETMITSLLHKNALSSQALLWSITHGSYTSAINIFLVQTICTNPFFP
eukprot:Phypoly_transcript_14738.p1 GENE.Phypoly_transcript_14738~~Phypoly_transcript_14738.p1  ORF type:complete len:128 (+),score=18.79 Phypoly_transcript_14738:22-384(+)